MPSNTIYQKYADLADKAGVKRNSKAAIDWFRKRIRKDRPIMLDKATEGLKTKGIEPGNLYIYGYNPKYEKTLKYYDNFPCCLVLETTKDGWYGLNLHYLPPAMRAKLLAENNVKSNRGLKIAQAMGRSRFGKHALHRYIANQLTSRPKVVPQRDWEIAIQLPFEGFAKISSTQIWRKARG